ncbi:MULTISPECIES: hypothetical protein [Pseudonocardia]|uniref:Uncharacterized protein n=2 Tax=Pseudonocardia TaxID=1847 RepID=A0A1Y2MWX8_PSEAH|nr:MULTISPECIES: hypothetical protein [Pseudonocardia]OSY39662.1 hypothetical protein BG845_03259 [Pseudonocardia autotrophica]TDN72793.1 hypothetical protein C8E95_1856 [Pseudonocardia autotrophica]BBG03507.1 hypothetical protein Pdca_47160 [Pseudonocardia autotrophica]GEC24927.1 hypothetical protein PSA01_19560 [Pseudonocardia saturnea]
MNVDADDLTAPILGRADIESLRRADSRPRHRLDDGPAASAVPGPAAWPWLALVVLGNLVVLGMLVLVVLWS